jgi:hypothetical protein
VINLIVEVAICGHVAKDPLNSSILLATCSRLFKYLASDYYEEFSSSFRDFAATIRLAHPDAAAQAAHDAHVGRLISLYGEEVLPSTLLKFYCLSLDEPCFCSADLGAVDLKALRGEFWRAMQKKVLIVEEHPTLSRFWTVGWCVQTLFLIDLFHIPPEAFSTQALKPREDWVAEGGASGFATLPDFCCCPTAPTRPTNLPIRQARLPCQSRSEVSNTGRRIRK